MDPPKILLVLTIIGISFPFQSSDAELACNKSAAQIFSETGPSVVRVVSIAIDPFSLVNRVRQGVGSGIVIEGGKVITNAHVVYEASKILISLDDERAFKAVVVGIDEVSDLAVIAPHGESLPVAPARLATSETLQVGTDVLAIGYPFGLDKSISKGIVSGKGRILPFTPTSWLTPLIQTDAAVNPGNSGGALVNLCGEVVGVNTLASRRGQNVNFAIPVGLVADLLPDLLEHGRVIRPWYGVYGRPVPPILQLTLGLPPGLLIETIEPGSPAEAIGLRGGTLPLAIGLDEYLLGGDIIMEVNGTALVDMETILQVVRSFRVGDRVSLTYGRDGVISKATVTLPERPVLPGDGFRFRERDGASGSSARH